MVNLKQGDIIMLNFDPQVGHEQAGFRPAVVVSNNDYNRITVFIIACPITNTNREYPTHVKLDERTSTTGYIMCEQPKTLDITSRKYKFVESLPQDILKKVLEIITNEITPTI